MFDFHEKRKIRGILYSKITIGILFILLLFLLYATYGRYQVAGEMEAKLYAKQAELEELKQRAEVLDAKVEYLKHDRGLEEELRNRFDVAREGEETVILIDTRKGSQEKNEVQIPTDTEPQQESSFFERLMFWN